ncbi:MAG: S8 family serine peptidase [Casimicrobiaceae bacterium]
MYARILIVCLALVAATAAVAQDRKRIDRAADVPRFTYRIDGALEDVIRDDAKFRPLAQAIRRDTESVLAQYDIADKAELRQLLNVIAILDYLEAHYDDAYQVSLKIRALQEKPADRLLSGMQLRAQVAAQKATGSTTSDAFRAEVGRVIAAELAVMPYPVIANDVKSAKARAETIGEALVLGNVRNVLQPTVAKTGTLSSDLVPGVVGAKYALATALPLKKTLIDTYSTYLAAHQVNKPDIWAERDIALPAGRGLTPVRIAVWDSGVDTALFPDRVLTDASGKVDFIGFDRYGEPSPNVLFPLPGQALDRLPQMRSRMKGVSDLSANIDSPEASEVKQFLSTLSADQYKSAQEDFRIAGVYSHGTHVAGIALAGNPYARLAVARIEFGYTLLPDPCPTPELEAKGAKNYQAYVDFMQKEGVRVVNMSWGGNVKGYERALELCGIGANADERKTLARTYFDQSLKALTAAIASAPQILFVASAGNSNSDASFTESYPSSIVLPNLLTVGAVDKAGDEAPFTSYGPTVVVHANGYQVDSFIPGGQRVALSGTSMSAPQVTNLAAKMLAVNPVLKPPEVIRIIRDTADKTADGRRVLVNPKKAIAAVESKKAG